MDDMFVGELDDWLPHIQDDLENGEFEMQTERLIQLQTEAYQAYNHLSSAEAGSYAVAIAAYEIALQQARIAAAMERIAARLDGWNASGVPVEHVGGH